MTDIYTRLKQAGCNLGNHESDLYVERTQAAIDILATYEHKANITAFKSQIDGKIWLDIPFAYSPFWEAKEAFIDNFYKA